MRYHTPEQVIRKLAEGDRPLNEGKDHAEVCRHLEIAESTWHRWANRFGGTSDKYCDKYSDPDFKPVRTATRSLHR
jgi:hypothetical protein